MFMRTSKRLRTPLLLCALTLSSTTQAQSPIRTGTLTISSGSSRPVVTLGGNVLDVRAVFDDGAFEQEQCRPCLAGSVVGVGGRISAAGRGTQSYEADFTITGTSVEIPRSGYADIVLTSPFRFQGRIVLSPRRESRADEKEPAVSLEGAGTVTVNFTSSIDPDSGERLYFFQDATYQFSPVAR